ncbi:uncharacterized protein LOC128399869 [Podarcis raffonei]|uniref:uncharacterized protein LOC128399868 n=1 Tax=Podarcis raffonei TaxID=65483 RepID=UPI00232983EE|nr:uncharacterized protein LOC128399868 [Podarcis raffonei]XP_053217661.1 uncharacterized protein LOC128399869 [Podarcis raffonei]
MEQILLFLLVCICEQGLSAPAPNEVHGILPKSKTKGIDFCGVDKYYYIVRSDLGCYLRSTDFHAGKDLEIFGLHNSVRGGDHYLADKDDFFYIIKGNSYRRVTNLNADSDSVVYTLHRNCQNGDHYFSFDKYFYIIFKKRGWYRRVTNMHTDQNAIEATIYATLKDGLYYWGIKDKIYLVKPNNKWGVEFYRVEDMLGKNPSTISFHANVLNFLPGGVSINHGKAFGVWQPVKTVRNDAKISVAWEQQITKKVGYSKKEMHSMEHNWRVSSSVKVGAEGLTKLLLTAQFSLSAQYGGKSIDSTEETWSDATDVSEKVSFTLPPNTNIYFWQYKLGLGKDDVLYCRDLAFTDNSNPPTYVPLPPAAA